MGTILVFKIFMQVYISIWGSNLTLLSFVGDILIFKTL